jgi:hypothetical protein
VVKLEVVRSDYQKEKRWTPKILCRKTVRENVDDDFLTEQYFPRVQKGRENRTSDWFKL